MVIQLDFTIVGLIGRVTVTQLCRALPTWEKRMDVLGLTLDQVLAMSPDKRKQVMYESNKQLYDLRLELIRKRDKLEERVNKMLVGNTVIVEGVYIVDPFTLSMARNLQNVIRILDNPR